MSVLTSKNTSKVHNEFMFTFDQVKNLKFKQFFIHTDLVNWMEKKLNSWCEWNAIKIIYNEIHHYSNLSHMKCVELYYEENCNTSNEHLDEIHDLIYNRKYNMPWISETTYYAINETELVNYIMLYLEKNTMLAYLTNHYNTSVVHKNGKHIIKVFIFSSELNQNQIYTLTQIFCYAIGAATQVHFVLENFLFLTSPEPPQIIKGELLTAFHGDFLHWLSIEDILSLELANKDHRLSWCDNALDRDIQKHLRKRLAQLNKKRKCRVYRPNEFSNQNICCYFIHKYSDRCSTIILQKGLMGDQQFQLLTETYLNLAENVSDDYAVSLEMVSTKNTPICIVTYIVTSHDTMDVTTADKNVNLTSRRVDIDMNSSIDFDTIQPNHTDKSSKNMRIDILKNMNDTPHDLYHVLRDHAKSQNSLDRLIICCKDFEYNILKNSILLNMFPSWLISDDGIKQPRFTFEFNSITFHVQTLNKCFKKLSILECLNQIDIVLSECKFILNPRVAATLVRKFNTVFIVMPKKLVRLSLKFVKIDLEVQTVFLSISGTPIDAEIIFDDCHISTAVPLIVVSAKIDFSFKKMILTDQTLVTIFNAAINCHQVTLDNCQIQFEGNVVSFDRLSNVVCHIVNMRLELQTLLTIMNIFKSIKIENCCIQHLDAIDITSAITIETELIIFYNMNINVRQVLAILSKRKQLKHVTFTSCQIMSDLEDMRICRVPAGLSKVIFRKMTFSPELLNLLTHFKFDCCIIMKWCIMSDQDIFAMCSRTSDYGKYIEIFTDDKKNNMFYFDLIGEFYQQNLNKMNLALEHDLEIPFHIFPKIFNFNAAISWEFIQIKSVPVNDGTIKMEVFFKGKPIDFFFESRNLPDDSDVCEISFD